MPALLEVRRSPIHGTGVFAAETIGPGEEVIEYTGRVMTHAEADAMEGADLDDGHTFLFTINDDFVVDAGIGGNDARWINHSCEPNCEAQVLEDPGPDRSKDRVMIVALREISPGEELTYDYGISTDEPRTPELERLWTCRCGAAGCRGVILQWQDALPGDAVPAA
ncbi:MAG TPA: SET domain-containing protein-lysine N-methyltransferase [Candidatus Binatia bacterium]|nr:SET domain-containing protein-lysine N-methyltransferase [Candidatus Binatia bacterium]